MNEQELTALFRVLGADHPNARARTLIAKGIAELPRDLFVMLAARAVIRPHECDWLTEEYPSKPDGPGGAFQPAVDRLVTTGAPVADLTMIVGLMQMALVVELCGLLDAPGELEPEVSDIRWRLFLCDQNGAPQAPIAGLAEILSADDSTEAAEAQPSEQGEVRSPAPSTGDWPSMNEQELTELFRKLGAEDPEGWARSQIRERIPQLFRYLFLHQAWSKVIRPDDRDWMTETFGEETEGEDDFAQAIDRVLATGARADDLTTIVRIAQWHVLFSFCTLLDGILLYRVKGRSVSLRELTGFRWRLYQVDENDVPQAAIDYLHESALSMDPTGLEMCPPQPAP